VDQGPRFSLTITPPLFYKFSRLNLNLASRKF
jgi:hypothetical protein